MWGEPVAAVCAMTEEIAERALELIDVEYELLPVVVDGRDAERMANEEGVLIHEDSRATSLTRVSSSMVM